MNHLRPNRRKNAKKDPAYKKWIASLPCVVCWLCGTEDLTAYSHEAEPGLAFGQDYSTEVAHIGERGIGQKCPDRETAPLCWKHHARESPASVHSIGKSFWDQHGLDPKLIISELNARYEREAV